jgi:hypothetical protein
MVSDDAWGLRIAVIAGVFVLGLIGAAVSLYLQRREERERQSRRKP